MGRARFDDADNRMSLKKIWMTGLPHDLVVGSFDHFDSQANFANFLVVFFGITPEINTDDKKRIHLRFLSDLFTEAADKQQPSL